ncbi:hypothetical protein U3516DRAFT_732390 [Neocallimastix sp. 'constans']
MSELSKRRESFYVYGTNLYHHSSIPCTKHICKELTSRKCRNKNIGFIDESWEILNTKKSQINKNMKQKRQEHRRKEEENNTNENNTPDIDNKNKTREKNFQKNLLAEAKSHSYNNISDSHKSINNSNK